MRTGLRLAWLMTLMACALRAARAQDLAPRAYLITPVHLNTVTLTWSFYDGNINYNGALPVSDATGTYQVPILTVYHSFNMFGRSANALASLPYARGNFQGTVAGAGEHLYRSGLLDSVYRVSVNLKGGPALDMRDFSKWKQKVLLGVSLKVEAPTGQYDPTKLVNWGTNRWSFKPEFGYSQRFGGFVLDGYAGAWFFTTKIPISGRATPTTRAQLAVASSDRRLREHLSYNFNPRLWASLDGNYWFGGKTSIAGVVNPVSELSNSRIGGTVSLPIGKHQSLKFAYSNGTYIRFGGNYQNVSVAWQYGWVGKHW